MIDEIKIRNGGMLICKIIRKTKNIVKKKRHKSKKKFNYRHKHRQMGTKYIKGKKGDFQVINLNLKPHLVSLFSSGRGGHCTTLLKRSRNLCSCLLLESRRHEMSLTLGYLVCS